MATYLLLRDNKQTGPHSYEDMLKLGFRKYDLVWVEGKSAAWRYPGEISEFSAYAPLVEEQPYDRFFKRKGTASGAAERTTLAEAEPLPAPVQKTLSDILKARKVAVTMPANHSSSPVISPQKKNPEPVKEKQLPEMKDEPSVEQPIAEIHRPKNPAAEIKQADVQENVLPGPPSIHAQIPDTDARYLPSGSGSASVLPKVPDRPVERTVSASPKVPDRPVEKTFTASVKTPDQPLENALLTDGDDDDLYPAYIPPKPFSGDYTRYLQYVGVAAALVSLLVVGILIGKGMDTEQPPAPVLVSEQPSRIAELKKKLMSAPANENVPASEEPETAELSEPQVRDLAIKEPVVPARKDLSVNTSYKTSAPPSQVKTEKPGTEKRSSAAPAETGSADLASRLSVSLNEYKINMFGGIDGIEVTVKNNASVPLEQAVVELRYILSNKNKGHLTETLVFRDLKPGQSKTIPGPKSSRGIRLEYRLVSAR